MTPAPDWSKAECQAGSSNLQCTDKFLLGILQDYINIELDNQRNQLIRVSQQLSHSCSYMAATISCLY